MKRLIERLAKVVLDVAVVRLCQRLPALEKAITYLATNAVPYGRMKKIFIGNGKGSAYDKEVRAHIVRRFEQIDREINPATSPTDGLFLAEALLSLTGSAPVVECGCFTGGSTAK